MVLMLCLHHTYILLAMFTVHAKPHTHNTATSVSITIPHLDDVQYVLYVGGSCVWDHSSTADQSYLLLHCHGDPKC